LSSEVGAGLHLIVLGQLQDEPVEHRPNHPQRQFADAFWQWRWMNHCKKYIRFGRALAEKYPERTKVLK
jgi:hypothetical protein